MLLATYIHNGKESIGVLQRDRRHIVSIDAIYEKLGKEPPKNMLELINNSNSQIILSIKSIVNTANLTLIPINNVNIVSPIPNPIRNIFCIGKNYSDHVKELSGLTSSDTGIPKNPVYFTKSTSSVIGHGDKIKSHSEITTQVDYEVELAVIIGKNGTNIKKEEAEDYVFGYTIANDITARDVQKGRNQWFKGKSLDTFCPMGPYIVHKSEIPFPVELGISSRVNGELRQDSNTKNMIFDIPSIISDLSNGMELKSGDIILTGTPSGVGMGFKPPKFLKTGDIVECEIENIGLLENSVK